MSQDSGNGERLLSQSFSDAVTALVDSASQLVVRVDAETSGSGVAWSQGVVVTANHVVGRSTIPTVTMRGGSETPAKLLGRDPYLDVAAPEIPTSGTHSAVRENTEVRVGQFVLALANASGDGVSATHGTVTSARRNVRGYWEAVVENAVVTDVRLNAGYSGGPQVDDSGRLLGINVAHFAGRSIAVPVDYLEKTVVRLSKGGGMKRGYQGVMVEPIELPQELSGSVEAGQGSGLLVRSVDYESPARAAGVALGDVILSLGETKATDKYSLYWALEGDVIGERTSTQSIENREGRRLSGDTEGV
ncbi:MAG: trypsin-like peptidase domain-containing protein [Nitrososphaerota archaeon]|nr:trypsin-like peptidase domain-containing protein [Nitrososphaerota archaeon]